MLYWFQLNHVSPKVNWCTNKSEVKYSSINSCQVSSVRMVWECNTWGPTRVVLGTWNYFTTSYIGFYCQRCQLWIIKGKLWSNSHQQYSCKFGSIQPICSIVFARKLIAAIIPPPSLRICQMTNGLFFMSISPHVSSFQHNLHVTSEES